MLRRVWKYSLTTTSHKIQKIEMPYGAKIIHVSTIGHRVCLWAEVQPIVDELPLNICTRSFQVFGTGDPIEDGSYVGTVIILPYVWHVYEV